jgi:isopentenyl-diphosphate delta-isomerase
MGVVAVILVTINVVASKADGRTAILRDLTVLTAPAIVGMLLWLWVEEPAFGWFGVGLTAVTAALFWLARHPEPGFRWAGTGAIGALAAAILLGLFSGLIIRTASWLSVDEIAINYPDFYQWAVVIVTIGLVLVVIALVLYGVRLWWSNGSVWRSSAKQRLDEAGYPEDAVEGLASSTVISRSLSETINGADVMITLAGMVMFAALVSRVVDFVFRGRSTDDWFPDEDRAWALLFDMSSWLALAAVAAAYLAVRSAIRSEATRRKIGIVWDVASFFPRSFHPLAPPAYAARAVPEIQARVTETVNNGGRVVLAGHSQGSVIVAAVMASLPDDLKAKTALVTYGSPLGRFYRPFFPAAFPDELVHALAERVGPGDEEPKQLYWINFYRSTDPIGQAALRAGELSHMSLPNLAAVALAARERTAIACDVLLDDPWETSVRPYRPIPRLRGHSGYESDSAWTAGVQSLAILLGQTADEEDLVVLVDPADIEIGTADKTEAHDRGLFHRAVSVFLFDSQGRLLIQKRAATKHIFAGLWANSSCTHPRPGESPVEAGRRSLRNELGLDAELIDLATFDYRATDETTGLTEAELDHVLIGTADQEPEPSPDEVADHEWTTIADLRDRMRDEPQAFTPWLSPALAVLERAGILRSD